MFPRRVIGPSRRRLDVWLPKDSCNRDHEARGLVSVLLKIRSNIPNVGTSGVLGCDVDQLREASQPKQQQL